VAILSSRSDANEGLDDEIAAVERAGQPLTKVSADTPALSIPILFALVRLMIQRPAVLSRTVATLLLRGGRHRVAALTRLPLAVQLGQSLPAKGISHLHAADSLSSVVAWAASQSGTLTFSASISRSPGASILRKIVSTASFIRVNDPGALDRTGAVAAARRKGVALLPHTSSSGAAFVELLEQHAHNAPPSDAPMLQLDWRRLGAERIGLRWMTTRYDAGVAEVTIDDGRTRRNAILKHHRRVPPFEATAAGRAMNEAATLRRLHERMPRAQSVPEVLFFDEESLTLVMEQAPGVSLDRLFAETSAEKKQMPFLLDAIGRAALWLRAMQKVTHRNDDSAPLVNATIVSAVADLETVAKQDRVIRGSAMAIRSALNALGESVSRGMQDGVTGHHGDFWPGNIFVDPVAERVTVIDLEGYREGLPLEDAAYFLLRTELLGRRFRLPVTALQQAFAAAYGSGVDDPAVRLFTITKGLQTMKHTFQGNLGPAQRIWTLHVLRKSVLRASRR
jgi:hypothetical protein